MWKSCDSHRLLLRVFVSNTVFSFCPSQQREEKQLEAAVESLASRVAHVKNALHSFIYKLENEYERLTWWADRFIQEHL